MHFGRQSHREDGITSNEPTRHLLRWTTGPALAVLDHTTHDSRTVGGRQLHSLEWAQTLAILGCDVDVYFNPSAIDAVSDVARRCEIDWGKNSLVRPVSELRSDHYDAIISAGTWIRLPDGVPVISRWIDPTVMPNAVAQYGTRLVRNGFLTPWDAYGNVVAIWMQSETQRRLLTDRHGSPPSGIPAAVFHAPRNYILFQNASRPWGQRDYDLCFVGRDHPGKRMEFFLRVAKRLGLRAAIATPKIEHTNVPHTVRLLSAANRRAVASLLGNSRVFLFAPVCEVCPQAVFEALNAGCIPITNANGSMPEQIADHGYLFHDDDCDAACEMVATALQWPHAKSTRIARMTHALQFDRRQTIGTIAHMLRTCLPSYRDVPTM